MIARFLYYSADSLSAYLQENQKLPIIVQFLFYNGSQAPYPHPTDLKEYYSYPEWGSQEVSLRFHLIDATQISDEALLKQGHCAPMCLLLKHGRKGEFELEPNAYRPVFQEWVDALGDDYVYTMLNYTTELSNLEAGEKMFHFVEEILTNKQELIMTYAQKIERRGELRGEKVGELIGEKKGELIGRERERLSLAKSMLRASEDKEKVMKFTHLTMHQIERLLEKDS